MGAVQEQPIGVFDSGVGGLSVWREIVRLLPAESILYLADQAHVPYGERPPSEVARLTSRAVAWLWEQGVKIVVIACNTASSAALNIVRQQWPDSPIVGMEPAVKPASQHTRTGHVGVLATPGTLRGERFTSLVERFANGVHVHTVMGSGLVSLVEAGQLNGPVVEQRLKEILAPVQGVELDHLVLGCTHFPFLADAIARVLPDGVKLVDPAPAVARQTQRVLARRGWLRATATHPGAWRFVTTGSLPAFRPLVERLVAPELRESRRDIRFESCQF